MNIIERCILIVELAGWEYGLSWWATWLVLAALAVYLYGAARTFWECWQEDFEPNVFICAIIILLWPGVWYMAKRSERRR